MISDQFLALNNIALKVVSVKKYSKVWIILEVNNEVVAETWMARRSIADYINTSLHGFAYFVLHPSFKRPFFAGENSNLLHRFKISFDVLSGEGGGFMKNVAVTFSVPKLIYELPLYSKQNNLIATYLGQWPSCY